MMVNVHCRNQSSARSLSIGVVYIYYNRENWRLLEGHKITRDFGASF
jgi:hypothetical protein